MPDVVASMGLSALTDPEFICLRDLILEHSGITLGDSKKQLVASRLARRLRLHHLTTYGDYYALVTQRDRNGEELRELINAITTNKTEYFREPHHFEFLCQTYLPKCIERAKATGERRLRVWSAGCSTGEEPYTLAMTLKSFAPLNGWDIELIATDLDTQVLARAQAGIYAEETIAPVPDELRRRFFKRGKGDNAGKMRVNEELRSMIAFRQLNLIQQPWAIHGLFDLILCRNVMIYFNADTQKAIVHGFGERLREDGYLFIGHSETLHGVHQIFEAQRGTIYRRRRAGEVVTPGGSTVRSPSPAAASAANLPEQPGIASRATLASARSAPSLLRPNAPRRRDERGLGRVNVIIGGVRASGTPIELRTVLGSCVCACIHDPVAKIGGINHFMLPDGLEDLAMPTRFGVNAMEVLINSVLKLGADRRSLQAKAFGAAHVLSDVGLSAAVPRKNAQFIKEFLKAEGIPLVSSRLGGSAPVEVVFVTDIGKALVRPLGDAVARDLAREESRHDLEIRKQLILPQAGSVELF